MPRRNEGQPQPLGIQRMVVVGFAGQQTVRALGDGLGKQTAARTADDRQPVHRLSGICKLHLHRCAGVRRVAQRCQLVLRQRGQLRHGDGVDFPHPAAAVCKGGALPDAENIRQHIVHPALGGIQIRVHTDGGNARLYQLIGHIGGAQPLERVGSIVLAGVSAQTTWEIIEKAPWVSAVGGPRLVMVPATRHSELRRWLWQHGFALVADRPVQAAGRWYAVMAAEYTGEVIEPTFTQCLLGDTARWPEGAGYAAWQRAKLPRMRMGVPDGSPLAAEMDAILKEGN